jgi:hypothetical protein
MSIDIRREAEELVRYYGELGRRISQKGVRDVADLLSLYEQLRRALDAVSRQEIAWAVEQTERLVEHLVHMDANLQALRRLKGLLGGLPSAEARPGEASGLSPADAARLP